MIQLKNVNKYYNRRKKNEIHVINDTSLTLEDTGLVAILGPSGCGKTTLLNAIGGLDHVSNGQIIVNGKKMNSAFSGVTDKVRNLNIGYIFQDYHLLNDKTVFENVAIALRMVGIRNKEEIKKRVDYVLQATNMYRYRNRVAANLSGGERQRVGIARALAKNPPIIIADEPTGNLDSKNTIEVMNIIKGISQTKLVILVTHEKDLAYFYASRIIEVIDGKVVNDYLNVHENKLDYRIDNKLYLQDFSHRDAADNPNMNVEYFHDDDNPITVRLVAQNGNLYIQTEGFKKVEIVDDESAVELIDGHYEMISQDDYQKNALDMSEISGSRKLRYSSINNIFGCIIQGFKRIGEYSVIKKILLAGFAFAAMAILYAGSQIMGTLTITDDKFLTTAHDYLKINMQEVTLDDFAMYENMENVDYVLPGNGSIRLNIPMRFYFQTSNATEQLNGSLLSSDSLVQEDLIAGRLPENENEIVVDMKSINTMLENQQITQLGYKTPESLIGLKAEVEKMGELEIVGIVNKLEPAIYASPSQFTNLLVLANGTNSMYDYEIGETTTNANGAIGITDYQLYLNSKSITKKKGKYPVNDYEVMINYSMKDVYKIGKKIPYKVNGKKLKVVGYYKSSTGIDEYLVSNQTLKYDLITKTADITICTKQKEEVISQVQQMGVNITNPYEEMRAQYLKNQKDRITGDLVVSGIIILISLVEIFLMLRSSFLSRVKEVGVLRAIGVKKSDIYKMYAGEIIAITLITGAIGFGIMSYVIYSIKDIRYLSESYIINPLVIGGSVALYFLFNLIVGLIPLYLTLRKSPAQILSRNDVD